MPSASEASILTSVTMNIASVFDEYSNGGRCYILHHVETYSRSNRQHLTCFLRKVNVYQAFGGFLKPQHLT
jgi:hypothetical protein